METINTRNTCKRFYQNVKLRGQMATTLTEGTLGYTVVALLKDTLLEKKLPYLDRTQFLAVNTINAADVRSH